MIKFFPDEYSAYEAFNAQANPYKFSLHSFTTVLVGCIFFFLLNTFNPQSTFQMIFEGFSFLIVAFHSLFFIIWFMGDEKIIKICATRYTSENMQRRKLIFNSPGLTYVISPIFFLQLVCMAIFYLNSYYFYFSILLISNTLDFFKSNSIHHLISLKIGEIYIENMNKEKNDEKSKT